MPAVHDPNGLAPELDLVKVIDGVDGLLRLSHLDQSCVLLVEQDLHSLKKYRYVTIDFETVPYSNP